MNEISPMALANPSPTQGYSEFLPPSVISTLTDNAHLHDILAQKQDMEKAQIEKHINECLKEIIRMFEALKLSLWAKADEKTGQFNSLFEQLESLSLECSNWAEKRLKDALENFPNMENQYSNVNDRNVLANQHKSEKLAKHLQEMRTKKLRANAVENALLAVDQKIDAMRLVEISEEVREMATKPTKIYYESPALLVYQKIQKAVALGLKEIRVDEVIRINEVPGRSRRLTAAKSPSQMREHQVGPERAKMNAMTFNGKGPQTKAYPSRGSNMEMSQPTGSGLREPKFIPKDFAKKKASRAPMPTQEPNKMPSVGFELDAAEDSVTGRGLLRRGREGR